MKILKLIYLLSSQWLSVSQLADKGNVSVRTAERALNIALDNDYFTVIVRRRNLVRQYKIKRIYNEKQANNRF